MSFADKTARSHIHKGLFRKRFNCTTINKSISSLGMELVYGWINKLVTVVTSVRSSWTPFNDVTVTRTLLTATLWRSSMGVIRSISILILHKQYRITSNLQYIYYKSFYLFEFVMRVLKHLRRNACANGLRQRSSRQLLADDVVCVQFLPVIEEVESVTTKRLSDVVDQFR